ncbi:MAG: cation diffusion facilitator family transporter [Verrucomicrobiae bacterium]|nr:cation diffusion facilitator family transporter [Verrucomicrobiae bacterium]
MSDHHHDHGTENVSDKVLLWSVIINLGLSLFEFIAGIIAGSVALMADATHNTNDAAALLIAYIARRFSRRSANDQFTFGYRRAELIGAMIQLTALVIVGLFLVYESIARFIDPEPISGLWVIAASCIALVVDVLTAWLLWSMSKGSLNVKAAFLHNLTDAGASVAVLFGGLAIYYLEWSWVDPLITLIIAVYILYMSFGMLKRTSTILMEGVPEDFDLEKLRSTILDVDGVVGIHHLHVWELDEHHRALEAHIVMNTDDLNLQTTQKRVIKDWLKEHFDIAHATLEFEQPSEDCSEECEVS